MNPNRLFLGLLLLLAPLVAHAQTYPSPNRPVDNTVVIPCIQTGAYKSCLPTDVATGAGAVAASPNTSIQFNNGGSFGGAAGFTYTNPGSVPTLTGPDGSSWTSSGITALTLKTSITGSSAQCLEANTSGLVVGTGAICGGSGSVPGGSSTQLQYNNGGAFGGTSGLTWTSSTHTLTFPDGGNDTTTNMTIGSYAGPGNGAIIYGISTAAIPVPGVTTAGAGVIGIDHTGYLTNAGGGWLSQVLGGLVIQGWPAPISPSCNSGTTFCQVNNTTFVDQNGQVIAGVQAPATTAPWPWLFGAFRYVNPTAANEGLAVGQSVYGDTVFTGTVEGPRAMLESDTAASGHGGPAFIGWGPESPTNFNIFWGSSDNEISPWDDRSTSQPDIDALGCWGGGVASGAANEGTPLAYITGKLCGLSGGGFEVENTAKSADAGIKAAAFIVGGSTPTLTGTCTTSTQVGGNTAGSFHATCSAQTVIITFATTAAHGWVCNAHDETTPADSLNQTSHATTSCTLTGTTAAADNIVFNAVAF